jgi:hypothetical protein
VLIYLFISSFQDCDRIVDGFNVRTVKKYIFKIYLYFFNPIPLQQANSIIYFCKTLGNPAVTEMHIENNHDLLAIILKMIIYKAV